jgi:ubiquinone/menaquinone biosynthesis C-methylase UbiE/8-oxo-dGTP pyrophosphatase MutT (NUDIX family)
MLNAWDKLHNRYKDEDWIDKPNIFAEEIIKYLKKDSKILDIGAGQGQDSRYFAENGFDVISSDISKEALKINNEKVTDKLKDRIKVTELDMTENLPFNDNQFDAVYAHLSFHYFDSKKTKQILNEIYRVLSDGGLLIMLNNSTTDPEYGIGEKIENDYFLIKDKNKRFFSVSTLRDLVKYQFNTILLDDLGETYKDSAKGVHNLIRFVGSKIAKNDLFQTALPFTGGIIERTLNNGDVELLLQTRWKPEKDPVYSGTFEFPAGVLDKGYENIYDSLKREIFEETGLKLKRVKNDSQTKKFSPKGDDSSFGYKPFCQVQQLKNGKPWIGSIFICEVEEGVPTSQKSEAKDVRWMNKEEVRKMFEKNPEKFFTLELPAWEYYFNMNSSSD